MMHSNRELNPIRVGVLADEPLRMEGIASILDALPDEGYRPLSPVFGSVEELLSDGTLSFLVVDLHSSSGGVKILEAIRRRRPGLRLIVIGPEGDDELVLDSIMAGARAYLDLNVSPQIVRKAVEEVTNGSIWAPRRLLSQLIDRLLGVPDASLTNKPPSLTARESQVLELILTARSNREIARELDIEERTVQAHVSRLMRKTGADRRICRLRIDAAKIVLDQIMAARTEHPDEHPAAGHLRRRGAGNDQGSLRLWRQYGQGVVTCRTGTAGARRCSFAWRAVRSASRLAASPRPGAGGGE
jgi:DNA-binding NarL/FixJ family response regulator